MSDVISRQAAIDALDKRFDSIPMEQTTEILLLRKDLRELPSIQPERPEQPESAKEYCAECDHIEMCRWYPYEGCEFRSLPSAQPERKKGEWVLQSDDYHEYYECDQCGIAVGLDDVRNFCCNCGADMRGDSE